MGSGKILYVEVVGNVGSLVSSMGKGAAAVEGFGARASVAGNAYNKTLKEAEARSKGMTTVGKGLLAVGGVIAVGFGYAVAKMAEFEAKMANVHALLPALEQTTQNMTDLKSAALTMGQDIGFSATDVADAETELVKAGISVKDILGGALKGSLDLAAAGQTDLASATETAAIAMTQFGLSGKDVPHIADLLAAGADRALGSVDDLSQALKYGGSAAAQAGWSLDATVGTLAEFAQGGQMGSRAGMELQQMFRNLQRPGSAAAAMLDKYKIATYQANGQMVTSSQLAGELHDKLGSLPPQQRNVALATIFTSNAVRGANILMKDGAAANAQWIRTVNAQGFAALQASGKMNSLSGDVSKLKAAFDNAMIGVGENANGPLRVLVQDVTSVIQVWNGLPGPVKAGVEALAGVVGVTALVSGGILVLKGRAEALAAAMEVLGVKGATARTALLGLGKTTAVAAALVGVYEGAKALSRAFEPAAPSIEKVTAALLDLSRGTDSTGLTQHLIPAIALAQKTMGTGAQAATGLDQAMSDMVTGGHADQAAQSYGALSAQLHAFGLSTAQITALFPKYGTALADSANSAREAGTGMDKYGNAVSSAAQKTADAAAQVKKLNDEMTAASDPVFALSSALQDVKAKQKAAGDAAAKYGKDSHQAKTANLALAQSMVAAQGAANNLKAAVQRGDVSVSNARTMMRAFGKSMGLTGAEADSVVAQFDKIIGRGQTIAKLHPNLTVTSNTSQAMHDVQVLIDQVRQIAGHTFTYSVDETHHISITGGGYPTPHHKDGGPISGPGTGTSDSIAAWLSDGEYVMPAEQTRRNFQALEMMRRGYAKGGLALAAGGHVTQGNVLAHLSRILPPGSSPNQIQNAVDALNSLATAWADTIQSMQDAASKRGLVKAVADAQTALDKANKASGKQAAQGVKDAKSGLHDAKKALADFNEQQRQTNITNRIAAALARVQARQALADNKAAWQFERMTAHEQINHLTRRMAHEQRFSDQWLADEQQRKSLLQTEADAQTQAVQARQHLADNRTQVQFDAMSSQQQLAYLDAKIAGEQRYSDQWMSDYQARASLLASLQADEDKVTANTQQWAYDHMNEAQQIAYLNRKIALERKYSDEWMTDMQARESLIQQLVTEESAAESTLQDLLSQRSGIIADEADAHVQYDKAVAAAAAAYGQAVQSILDQRRQAIEQFSSAQAGGDLFNTDLVGAEKTLAAVNLLTDAMRNYGTTVTDITAATRTIQQDTQAITEWAANLQALRDRGLGQDAIAALGLDTGPDKLSQVRSFASATTEQIGQLNAAIAAKMQAAGAEVSNEQTHMYGAVGDQLRDAQSTFNGAVAQAADTLKQQLADDEAKLAALGLDTGQSISDAIAEGLASGLPGIVAAVQAVVDALARITAAGGDPGGIIPGKIVVPVRPRKLPGGEVHQNPRYDGGGVWPPGTGGWNASGLPEFVFTTPQMRAVVTAVSRPVEHKPVVNYHVNVDARGAVQGVDVQIRDALDEWSDGLASAFTRGSGRYG